MGLLDKMKDAAVKAGEQVKDVADKAGEQIQQGINSGKEQLEDAKIHKQILELLAEIGGLVLHQRRGDAPEDAAAQIDAKIALVDELETKLQAMPEAAGETSDAPQAGSSDA